MADLRAMEQRHDGAELSSIGIKRTVIKTPTVDWANRLVQGIISTENVDLDGEVVVQSGIDTSYFLGADKESGVRTVYWDHEYSRPIGTCTNLKMTKDGMYASTYITRTPLGEEVLTLVDEGIVRGQSIGYRRIDSSDPTIEEAAKYGAGCDRVTRKSLLLEFSITPMPCNPEALMALQSLVARKRVSQKMADLLAARPDDPQPIIVVTAGGVFALG